MIQQLQIGSCQNCYFHTEESRNAMPDKQSSEEEKRYAPRYRHRCYGTIEKTSQKFDAHLINISSTGILLAVLDNHNLSSLDRVSIVIELENDESMKLIGTIAHTREHYIGVECSAMSNSDRAHLENVLTFHAYGEGEDDA